MNPLVVASVSLLALQVSLLALTGGILVSMMISLNETLSLIRRTAGDAASTCRRFDALACAAAPSGGADDLDLLNRDVPTRGEVRLGAPATEGAAT